MELFDGLLGDVVGGLLGFTGAQQTNQANWDISQSNNAWSAAQFAQRYQTTVTDMQKAGLNPMLAYSQGGGSPPTAAPVQPMQNKIGSAVAGYNERRINDSLVALQGTQAEAAKAQANASDTQAQLNSANTNLSNVNALKTIQDTAKSQQDTKTSAASEASIRESIKLINEQTQTQRTQQRLHSASAGVQAVEQQLRNERLYKEKVTKAPYEWVDKNIIQPIKPHIQLPEIIVRGNK